MGLKKNRQLCGLIKKMYNDLSLRIKKIEGLENESGLSTTIKNELRFTKNELVSTQESLKVLESCLEINDCNKSEKAKSIDSILEYADKMKKAYELIEWFFDTL